jgi:nucleoside-diphosphate-sugar epimerase
MGDGLYMKVLVTGATGLLGSHLVDRLLEQGHEVRALSRKTSDTSHLKTTGAEMMFASFEDYNTILATVHDVDVVIHTAARVMPGWGTWEDFESAAVKGTKNLLEASVEAGVKRFVYISSVTVLGKNCLQDIPADESSSCEIGPVNCHTFYEWSKLMGEQTALEYHKQGNINVTIVRPGMIYGPRCRLLTERIFSYLKMLPIVFLPGKGNAKTALVYVTDVADCIIMAATSDKAVGQIYNVAPAHEVRYRDFVEAMARAMGKPEFQITMPIFVLHAVGTATEFWAKLRRSRNLPFLTRADVRFLKEGMNIDGSKAMRDLGWEPKISIEEGTRLYVQWRKGQGNGTKASAGGKEIDLVSDKEG